MKYYSQGTRPSFYPLEEGFGALDTSNRWIVLAQKMPWDIIERDYNALLRNKHRGANNKPARMVIGALIIKHRLGLGDDETINSIQENPYMQYFIGLHSFTTQRPFARNLLLKARKRMGDEFLREVIWRADRLAGSGKRKRKRAAKI